MIQSFADKTTADIFRERNSKDARQIPRVLWHVVQRKLKMLDVAARVDDLESPPGNRLKALKGHWRGRYSIRVNEQYRVTFRWENGHAFEVAVEDYHSGATLARAGDTSGRNPARGVPQADEAGAG